MVAQRRLFLLGTILVIIQLAHSFFSLSLPHFLVLLLLYSLSLLSNIGQTGYRVDMDL